MYIEQDSELKAFVQRASEARILCIDTEFLREKTSFAKLCLLQMATDDETVLVDTLRVKDLTPLQSLFKNEAIMKVFHAGGQDLEILLHDVGCLPHPLFDTQVAATLLGYSQQIGLAALVQSLCHVTLKKADAFTDWSRRPLTESQLEYASEDVVYLPKMYDIMVSRLEERGRLEWLQADFDAMADESAYVDDPRERYRRLKRTSHLSRRQLSAAREVAAWREEFARKHDIPRKWVITDEQVVEACKREARTMDELYQVRGIREKLSVGDARTVAAAIAKGLDLPEDEWPQNDQPRHNEKNVDPQIDLMMSLVRLRSKEHDVALQTLASHKELESLARGYRKDIDLLHGWRRSLVGNELLDLLDGKIRLGIGPDGLEVYTEEEPAGASDDPMPVDGNEAETEQL